MSSDHRTIRIACLGDSHTRGFSGYDWVGQLQTALEDQGVVFGNFGVNGELAYHAAQRLEPVIAFEPDAVVVLLGSNDVNAISSESFTRIYMKSGTLPQVPDKAFFVTHLASIIERIQKEATQRIVLLSLPPLGEDLQHPSNRLVESYNAAIQVIAADKGVAVLDLFEALKEALETSDLKRRRPHFDGKRLMYVALARRHLLCQSWNRISRANGLYLLTDTIHLNERAGRILASLVAGYLAETFSDLAGLGD